MALIEHVAIIGGGFSGTLQAVNLLRHDGPRATLIERGPQAGEGLAYGAAHPTHLLNVRAASMSAFPDDADHFVRWLKGHGIADPAGIFVPRVTYGAYLRELLEATVREAGARLRVVRGDVVDAAAQGEGGRLTLADDSVIDADAAVLAVGNLPPHDPPGLAPDLFASDLYKGDPWDPSVPDGLGPSDTVLVIGTGLTMVDIVLMLEARGFKGPIVALSRRGLLPRAHAAPMPFTPIAERPRDGASALLHRVRERGEDIGWRNAVDELRPFTQAMWANAGIEERERFLRHLRPWWDVHRHRLAPPVAERIAAMQARGQLSVVAGKTLAFEPGADGIAMVWRPRGAEAPRRMTVQRIVNCTGPLGNLQRTDDPLLRTLRDRGTIRPDAAHLGIDVDAQASTIARDGTPNPWLYALGPMTRGAFWEIVAVPDIRAQSWTLARRLSNAHWVGGEGL